MFWVGCVVLGSGVAFADGEYLPPSVTIAPPDTTGCPQQATPPEAVDTSEAIAPGATTPAPLPVPEEPVGGPAMGSCGFLLPAGAPAVPPDITAHAWMVADLTTGEVLGGKDMHGRYRPASTLKLLTVLAVWRTLADQDQTVTGTFDDAAQEGSRVGIGEGGTYTVRDLLLGLILNSGNDAANALARANGGTATTLAEMNSVAASIGALDTRAATVSGLDGPGQQTSVYDLGLIMQADLQLPGFAQLLGTTDATFPGYGEYPAFGIANENKLLAHYEGALGGKTGFTNDARNTFVGVAQRGSDRLLVSMLGGTQQPRRQWMQAASLLDWGFAARAADLNPVGRLVAPGADLEESASAASASADSASSGPQSASRSAASTTSGDPSTAGDASTTIGDDVGSSWLLWTALVAVAGVAVVVVVRRRRPAVQQATVDADTYPADEGSAPVEGDPTTGRAGS